MAHGNASRPFVIADLIDVIVLSDGESDDEVAFVGSHACAPSRNPSSPVFVRAQSGVGIIELTDDESGPEGRMISSDAPDFDAVFPPVVSDHQPTVDDEDDWGADLWDDREVLPVTNDSLLETPAGPSTASAIDITSSPVERVPLPARVSRPVDWR
jgi:hypothetical protein